MTDSTRIVVLEAEEQVIGIMVDAVAEVIYIRQSEIESAPNVGNEESARFIHGVCNRENELVILVAFEKMLTDEEWAEIEAL